MAKKKRQTDPNETLQWLELKLAVAQHCTALRAVILLLEQENHTVARARLEWAVTALHAVVRGQCAGVKMECPGCGSQQDVVAWVDDGKCEACGELLVNPKSP